MSDQKDHQIGSAQTLLKDGELKRLDLDGTAVVLARRGDEYFAVGGDCSHYGAPLEKGVLRGHTLMCPWHHACFDIQQGMRLEPPALNDISHFDVRVENGQVVVSTPSTNNPEPSGKADTAIDSRQFVIVGGGSAGNSAAEELRRSGFKGKITVVSQVPNVPIDRPNLSKDYLAGSADPAWMPLRGDKKWYDDRDIELRLETRVLKVDPKAHTVSLDNGGTITYDKLLLATGGIPRTLTDTPGGNLQGIYTLRTMGDCDQIIEAVEQGKQAVVIGSSFIGLEGAASLAGGRGASVTVVGTSNIPFDRILGEDIGRMFQQEHESKGIKFKLNAEIKGFTGTDHVTGVELKSGETISADFVVLGVGVRPATDFLKDSGLKLNDKDQSVLVSAGLQTSDPDIYAAGDIARWDDGSASGSRIEHWRLAEQHGIVAARSMLGNGDSMGHHVPFFWTVQWDINLRYVGHAEKWDEIVYRYGTPDKRNFIAFYVAGGKLLAAAGLKHDTEMDAIEFILRDNLPLTVAQMRDESFDLVGYARGK